MPDHSQEEKQEGTANCDGCLPPLLVYLAPRERQQRGPRRLHFSLRPWGWGHRPRLWSASPSSCSAWRGGNPPLAITSAGPTVLKAVGLHSLENQQILFIETFSNLRRVCSVFPQLPIWLVELRQETFPRQQQPWREFVVIMQGMGSEPGAQKAAGTTGNAGVDLQACRFPPDAACAFLNQPWPELLLWGPVFIADRELAEPWRCLSGVCPDPVV